MALHLEHLWLTDFRNYHHVDQAFPSGTTAIIGQNGQGKTNLVEAVAFAAGSALRGASNDTLVRVGAVRAIVRAQARRGNRELLVEAELPVRGRSRLQLNRQSVRRRRDLLEVLAVTVFSPDDLTLVKGGPGQRRQWLDDAVMGLDPRTEAVCSDVDKIIRQRNALLKQARGRLDDAAALTLDVWDERLGAAGTAMAEHRRQTLDALAGPIAQAYHDLAGTPVDVEATYQPSWEDGDGTALGDALAAGRDHDLRRGVTTVGPHRDDVSFTVNALPSRSHASQGEQRTLALAMRLAVHRALTQRWDHSPILLLDDVFSELDESRTEALLANLPAGQTLITTAGALPTQTTPDLVLHVAGGRITARDSLTQ